MIIDANINYGSWPFNVPYIRNIKEVHSKLLKNGIEKAFISFNEAILSPNPQPYNQLFLNEIRKYNTFIPVGIFNPMINNSQDIIKDNRYKVLKLVPSYHRYSLLDKKVIKIFEWFVNYRKVIFLQVRIEDHRNIPEILNIRDIKLMEIIKFSKLFPDLTIVCLGLYFDEAKKLLNYPNIYGDISFLERFKTIESILKYISHKKIVFGSHFPFFYIQCALVKIKYAKIKQKLKEDILKKNIINILKKEEIWQDM